MEYMDRFKKFIMNEKLLTKGDKVLIALSGGPDSMLLLHLLQKIKEELSLQIIVAHIDHDDREGTDKDALFVEEYMETHNIELELTKFDLSEIKGNLHDVGRKKRYEYLYDLAKKHKIDKIALGHHADDLVETILFRLARGSRIKGYGGLRPLITINNNTLIRPLLVFDKQEIYNICKENDIPYVVDPTNNQTIYLRNKLRYNVLPVLKNEFNDLSQKYLLFSNRLNDCVDYAMSNATLEIQKIIKNSEDGNIYAMVDDYLNLSDFVQEQLIYYLVNISTNNTLELNYKQISQINNIIYSKSSNAQITLSENIIFNKEYEKISVINTNTYIQKIEDTTINSVGIYNINDNLQLEVEEVTELDIKKALKYEKIYFSKNDIEFPLIIRTKIDGDRINTVSGNKKIKKVFIDNRVPLIKRNTIPILVTKENELLWIKDLALSYKAKMKLDKNVEQYYVFSYIKSN